MIRDAAPALSVVIVTCNSAEVVGACLRSLGECRIPGGHEIIVVDNASHDGTARIVGAAPGVHLIESPENLGFAAANNRAFAVARGALVLLLNPDTVLTDPTAIGRLMRALADHPGAGMAGGRLVFPDGRHQVGDAGFRPTTAALVAHGLGLSRLLPSLPAIYLARPDSTRGDTRAVDWICGACLLVRRSVIEAIGGLDERLFLYAEDVEWGCRARAAGFAVLYLPGVRVTHLQGMSAARAADAPVSARWLTALLDLHVTMNGAGRLPLARAALAAGFFARAVLLDLSALARSRQAAGRGPALFAYARAAWRYRPPSPQ